ncbi:MAG: hypothetical protein JSR45_12480 [Proteobacteria bacterium]|nr:hypothetical protein [Pseudomonadota bacterium]
MAVIPVAVELTSEALEQAEPETSSVRFWHTRTSLFSGSYTYPAKNDGLPGQVTLQLSIQDRGAMGLLSPAMGFLNFYF